MTRRRDRGGGRGGFRVAGAGVFAAAGARLLVVLFRGPRGGFFGAGLFDLQRGDHEVVPDQRGEGAAEHGTAVVLGGHRFRAFGGAAPEGDRVLVVPADEPGVDVVGGRAGLAGGEFAEGCGFGGAVLEHRLEHRGLGGGDFGRQHRAGLHAVDVAVPVAV